MTLCASFEPNIVKIGQLLHIKTFVHISPCLHPEIFFPGPDIWDGPRGSNLRFSLKIRAGPEWQKRNDTGRKSSNISSVFLSDLIWYVYCINCNTDQILFLNYQKLYDSFAAFMWNCWKICVENKNFASDFFVGSVKRKIWNIWFGKCNTLIPKQNTKMLWIDYFWY